MDLKNIKTIIIAIGGSPEPIVHSLNNIQVENAIFFSSIETSGNVTEILRQVSHIKKHEKITTCDAENIESCVALLMEDIPKCLEKLDSNWSNCLVDITGGTKPMASALTLATVHYGVPYSYVGGTIRTKEGVGTVVNGSERLLVLSNPWNSLVYIQRMHFCNMFNMIRFQQAKDILEEVIGKIDDDNKWKEVFQSLVKIAEGYSYWEIFKHQEAREKLNQGYRMLKPFSYGDKNIKDFIDKVNDNIRFLNAFDHRQKDNNKEFFCKDLYANALRRGELEEKYDDAVARLYRTLELIAQNELSCQFGIETGRCQPEQLPQSIQEEFMNKYWDDTAKALKFGLYASYHLLRELKNPLGEEFNKEFKTISGVLNVRNNSILAHGLKCVTKDTYIKLKEIVIRFVKFDTTQLPVFPKITL
jgi:CRISPR-associated protein (TIGR02710 family)